MIPNNVQQIRLMDELLVDNFYTFNCLIESYGESASHLNLNFGHNSSHINDCVNSLTSFNKLKYLKLSSPMTIKHINYIADHLTLKRLELSDVCSQHVNGVLNCLKKLKQLEIFIMFSGAENLPENVSHYCKFKSFKNTVTRIAKEGHTGNFISNINRNFIIYLPKLHFIQLLMNEPIDNLFKNEVFMDIKYLVLNMSGPVSNDVLNMIRANNKLHNFTIPELDLTQEIYDIFNEKSLKNPTTNYMIGIISSIKPYKQIIRENFNVFNNDNMILFHKLHSFL